MEKTKSKDHNSYQSHQFRHSYQMFPSSAHSQQSLVLDDRQPRTMSTPNRSANRTPIRSSTQNPNPRLRNPSLNVGTGTQRRLSNDPELAGLLNLSGSLSTMGGSSSGNFLNQHYTLGNSTARASISSGRSTSPRSSFSINTEQQRRDSLSSKPTTEELVDVMEREQDAIVMKLMKEINLLKEENRSLMNTINQLSGGFGNYALNGGSRSSLDSRRNSALGDEYEIGSLHTNSSRYNSLVSGVNPYQKAAESKSQKRR